jgi:hypothetical protein
MLHHAFVRSVEDRDLTITEGTTISSRHALEKHTLKKPQSDFLGIPISSQDTEQKLGSAQTQYTVGKFNATSPSPLDF